MNLSAVFEQKVAVLNQSKSTLIPSLNIVSCNTQKMISVTAPVTGNIQLSMYDISGKQLMKVTHNISAQHTVNFPIQSKIANGIYYIKLQTPAGTVSKEFTVSNF